MTGRLVRPRPGVQGACLAAAIVGAATLGGSTVGCTRRDAEGRRGAAGGAAPGVPGRGAAAGSAAAPVTAGRPGCPHDGRWRECSLVDRLDRAGLVPRVDSSPPERLAFLHAPGTVVRLGVGELHAFVYDDTAALARDVAALDTGRVAPRGGTYAWPAAPTFVRSGNLVAVLLTPNERQIERVQLALEGGPPNARSEVPR